jgi:hypothetical protein
VAQLFHKQIGFLVQLRMLAIALLVIVLVFVWRARMAYPAGVREAAAMRIAAVSLSRVCRRS